MELDDGFGGIPNTYHEFFKSQIGRGVGYIPHIGDIYQFEAGTQRLGYGYGYAAGRRGLGFSSFFSNLFKRAIPLLQNWGTKAVNVASDIAKDAIQGENIGQSAIKHLTTAAQNLVAPEPFSGEVNTNKQSQPPPSLKRRKSGSAAKNARRKNNKKTGRGYTALNYL